MSTTPVTEPEVEALKVRIELLESTLKDAHGFILAKFAFANDAEAIDMNQAIQKVLWPMPARWIKNSSGL